MAKLLYEVHYDENTKEVLPAVPTYRVLQVEPKDTILAATTDATPFIVAIEDAQVAKRLGLQKAENTDGRDDLYQVPKPPAKGPVPKYKPLTCGTLVNGHFVEWGPGFPIDD